MKVILVLIGFLVSLVYPISRISTEEVSEIPEEHRMTLAKHSYDVLGLGSAYIDLLVSVSEDFLKTVPGSKGGAQPIALDDLNHIIQLNGVEPHVATGGSCANAIKGLANLGAKCAFLSAVGTDSLGEHFRHYMTQLGVTPLFYTVKSPTARVLCLITPDGQRTMRFFVGSSGELSPKHLHPEYLHQTKIVHIDGYTLRNGQLTKKMMEMAKAAHAKISLDLASFEIVNEFHDVIEDLLMNYVDIVFANEDETRAFTGLSPEEGCLKLQEICPIAVVLLGDQGCLVGHQGEIFTSSAFPAHVVDTTGAGDLFASGFLYGYLNNYPLKDCARFGNRLGSAIVEVVGAELPEDRWKAIKASIFLSEPPRLLKN